MRLIFIISIFLVTPLMSFGAEKNCSISGPELQSFLKMDYKSFDQTLPDGGWRGLDNKGCHLEVAELVDIYHLHHMSDLEPWQARILFWHAGQVYAFENLKELALTRFRASFNPDEKADDDFKWNAYVRGTIAFMEGNLKALTAARDELVKVNEIKPNGNLKFLESFIRCFGRPYQEAYSSNCKLK